MLQHQKKVLIGIDHYQESIVEKILLKSVSPRPSPSGQSGQAVIIIEFQDLVNKKRIKRGLFLEREHMQLFTRVNHRWLEIVLLWKVKILNTRGLICGPENSRI